MEDTAIIADINAPLASRLRALHRVEAIPLGILQAAIVSSGALFQHELLYALGQRGGPGAVEFLAAVVARGDFCLVSRHEAIEALGALGPIEALPLLAKITAAPAPIEEFPVVESALLATERICRVNRIQVPVDIHNPVTIHHPSIVDYNLQQNSAHSNQRKTATITNSIENTIKTFLRSVQLPLRVLAPLLQTQDEKLSLNQLVDKYCVFDPLIFTPGPNAEYSSIDPTPAPHCIRILVNIRNYCTHSIIASQNQKEVLDEILQGIDSLTYALCDDLYEIVVPSNELYHSTARIWIRYLSIFSLRDINTNYSVKTLCNILNYEKSSVLLRHEVAFILGQMENQTSSKCLKQVLSNTNEHEIVRHEAAEALGSIANPDDLETLKQYAAPNPSESQIVIDSCVVALEMYQYWSKFK